MRYLKLFESFNEKDIHKICEQYYITNYTINPDGSIDVNNVVDLSEEDLIKLPLKFNKVSDGFWCDGNKLTSLEGSPIEVNGVFYCDKNKLTSFQFAPKIIRGTFNCCENLLTSFEYFPSFVSDIFFCGHNPIHEVWDLFYDINKIELLNDFDIFRDEDTDTPAIVMDRLNDFLLTIGKPEVKFVDKYKNI